MERKRKAQLRSQRWLRKQKGHVKIKGKRELVKKLLKHMTLQRSGEAFKLERKLKR